ncbi:AraC family transcriptional regulator N-terminal domain-containing protein [Pseudoduganella sp. RAF53_2]|uniref:AraC family transcriptional regulator n=1 Tax=unclassified Pseudoduganella TaxID=2637179 RepID=UPI003F9B6006
MRVVEDTMSLVELVRQYTERQSNASPWHTPIRGLMILRSDHEKIPAHLVFKPALCVTVQGGKWTTFGDQRFDYGAGQALVVSVEMPAVSRVVTASPDEPYLGVIIEFDLGLMREVLESLDAPPAGTGEAIGRGVFVTDYEGPLADCVLRLVRLLDTPRAIPVLSPLIMKEICYWLLAGPHGAEVAQVVLASSHVQRVVKAIHVLRNQFAEAVSIDDLAAVAQMSASAFHRQFKALTSMTPLQYQKQLRLMEARQLMVSGAANAETAAYQVGYESPSQFSREYTRMFGAPPRRDIESLRRIG